MARRLSSLSERLRSSLFFLPTACVILGATLALLTLEVDRRIVEQGTELPVLVSSTVDSARVVLSTVASATITFAGIAFSISLLVIQLASSQYSPRVVQGLLRDPFSKRVMAVVMGTFTYCLTVLRTVREAIDDDGEAVVPNVSVSISLVLGVVSILAIIAFINHSAHTMDVSNILARNTKEALGAVRRLWNGGEELGSATAASMAMGAPEQLVVEHDSDGWMQRVDHDALVGLLDPGATISVEAEVGRYAIAGAPLCRISPQPADAEAVSDRARAAVKIGPDRKIDNDVGFGVRQLADVALKALSPGVNDPTTAQDALFHMGTVLRELIDRRPPPRARLVDGDRLLLRPQAPDHAELIGLAFDEVRVAAAGLPTVCIYLLELVHLLDVSSDDGAEGAHAALRAQAALIRISADHPDLTEHDAARIRTAYDRRFTPAEPAT